MTRSAKLATYGKNYPALIGAMFLSMIAQTTASLAGSVTVYNCTPNPVHFGAYHSNDTINLMTSGPIIALPVSSTKTVKCATANCKLVFQNTSVNSQDQAQTYSEILKGGPYAGQYLLLAVEGKWRLVRPNDAKLSTI